MVRREAALWVLALAVLPGGVAADTMLEIRQVEESFKGGAWVRSEETVRSVWISEKGARIDEPGKSVLLPEGEDVVLLLDHERKTKEALRLPASFEAVYPEREIRAWREVGSQFESKVTLEKTERVERVGERTAEVYQLNSEAPRARHEAEVWIATDLGIHDLPYKRILRNLYEVDPAKRWLGAALDLEGFPLRVEARFRFPPGRPFTEILEVVSVEEAVPPEGTYSVPADYAEIPLDTSRWFEHSMGKPMP